MNPLVLVAISAGFNGECLQKGVQVSFSPTFKQVMVLVDALWSEVISW